ncbi:hypothetical protein BDU57DRAFT_518022 [Ampelomyces quisqualis]|uniref:Uncharacterized protein n=1 Tax=Ampelomyces quisqualis TaxID=50730 RepID=A0A6A5QL38_AMPQU|nr:hypothetical protein BDU57DRAFT_518022 [Ampelomyces quisqualis]
MSEFFHACRLSISALAVSPATTLRTARITRDAEDATRRRAISRPSPWLNPVRGTVLSTYPGRTWSPLQIRFT